jgi:signal transduction histidine kinase/DNA-binding response OmpR family regulator
MNEESIFQREQDTLRRSMELLASGSVPLRVWPDHYQKLLQEYSKLLRQSERLVRISDVMQAQLNTLNAELDLHRTVAEDANRAKSRFLAMMSHDIRAPLGALVGMVDLLVQTALTPDQIEYLSGIKVTADSLLELLNDILDLSKIETGKLDLACIPFNLWDCIGDTLRTLAVTAAGKGLELASSVHRDVPVIVIGDPRRLRQILMNLLNNAVKFTEKGEIVARVELGSFEGKEITVHCSLSDTGIGIPPDRLESVFKEFEQVDDDIMFKHDGTGLGLAICSRLVEKMGGAIWVESEVGNGTTFHFTCRFQVPDRRDALECRDEFAPIEGCRVLVIEDNTVTRQLLEEFLRQWKVDTASAASAPAALDMMREARKRNKPFEAAVIGAVMPHMIGFDLMAEIGRDQELADCAIILLTSLENQSRGPDAASGKIIHRIPKPPKLRDLLTTIRRIHAGQEVLGTSAVAEPVAPFKQPKGKLRILVADDNPVNRLLAVHMLEKTGQTVVAVEDGDAVLRSLAENEFDVILMDVEMPRKNGLETTRAIREQEVAGYRHIPIIAMTAHAMEGDQESFLTAGMDGYASKPIDWGQLLETIKTMT